MTLKSPDYFPPYAHKIMDLLIKHDWLVHALYLDRGDNIYDPGVFHEFKKLHNTQYILYIDSNIYQYIFNAYKKQNKQQLHRVGIALVVFCMLSNITIDPTFAVYEKINYRKRLPDEILDDLTIFRRIYNASVHQLADFALGLTDTIDLPEIAPIDRGIVEQNLTKYERLEHWETFKVLLLKIIELYFFNNAKVEEKPTLFLDWCREYFIYSTVSIAFFHELLSATSVTKLMKFKPEMSEPDKSKAVINMVWDLFFAETFFEKWKIKPNNIEYIFASNDEYVRKTLIQSISIQDYAQGFPTRTRMSKALIQSVDKFRAGMKNDIGRKVNKKMDFKCHRNKLISELEAKLGY